MRMCDCRLGSRQRAGWQHCTHRVQQRGIACEWWRGLLQQVPGWWRRHHLQSAEQSSPGAHHRVASVGESCHWLVCYRGRGTLQEVAPANASEGCSEASGVIYSSSHRALEALLDLQQSLTLSACSGSCRSCAGSRSPLAHAMARWVRGRLATRCGCVTVNLQQVADV